MEDVTGILEKAEKKARKEHKGKEDFEILVAEAVQAEYNRIIEEAENNNPHCEANIVPFYNNNVYYLIVDKVYNDVRFVGAPPSNSEQTPTTGCGLDTQVTSLCSEYMLTRTTTLPRTLLTTCLIHLSSTLRYHSRASMRVITL